MSQRLLSFCGCMIFHCVDLPHFVYPFSLVDTWAVPALGTLRNKAAVNIHVFVCTCFSTVCLEVEPWSHLSALCDHLRSHERAALLLTPSGKTQGSQWLHCYLSLSVQGSNHPGVTHDIQSLLTLCCCVVPEAHHCSRVRPARDETHKDEEPTQESPGYTILASVSPLVPKSET